MGEVEYFYYNKILHFWIILLLFISLGYWWIRPWLYKHNNMMYYHLC